MPPRKKQPSDPNAAPTPARKGRPRTRATAEGETAVTRKRTSSRTATGPAAGGGAYDLVIVESPAKAKTINKYLGQAFRVLASYGHVRDLATSKKGGEGEEVAGIRISEGWRLRYLVDAGSRSKKRKGRRSQQDILAELRTAASKAQRVLLASDPDREGESIAWHIADELRLDPNRTFRIRFNEITKAAIQTALAQPEQINMDRVKAQEARRAMDRVVGFPLSNLLSDKVTRGLSAGRVQSVAVKLIVDRELEIEAFRTEEYWKLTALLAPMESHVAWRADPKTSKILARNKPGEKAEKPKKETPPEGAALEAPVDETPETTGLPTPPPGSFLAELARWEGAEPVLKTEADADRLTAALAGVPFVVTRVEQKDRADRPSPPFTTSTLQQQANMRLRFTAKRTMDTAQRLYEGIDLGGEGQVALITYMRTDSTRISNDALNAVRTHIETTYGPAYLPAKPVVYASGKNAQEAHECIRPTDVSMTPQRAASLGLTGDQLRLYTLIYNRFVACQMTPAVFAVTSVEVTAGPGLFKATGRVLKFDGYRRVLPPGKQEDTELPALREQQALDRLDLFETQHFTQPPPRYNEASLVKMLEKEGIGRPSTYASIIETIQARGYVDQRERRLYATEIGIVVTKLLVEHFPRIMDLKFTSHFEEELDDIETGKCAYADVLNEFWGPFSNALAEAKVRMPEQRAMETGEKCPQCGRSLIALISQKTKRRFVGCSGYKEDPPCRYIVGDEGRPQPEETDIPCPKCGKMMLKRIGKSGPFLGCSRYPDCKTTMNISADGTPVPSAVETEHKCEKCGKPMVIREGRRGPFLACTGYPKCKNAKDVDAQGNPLKPIDTGVSCEKCGSPMAVRKGPRGPFLGCTAYPRCRSSKPLSEELKEKLKDVLPAPTPKKTIPEIVVTETCPECSGPMKLRPGRFGKYFLGCAGYPKCKGTRPVPPEVLERMEAPSPA